MHLIVVKFIIILQRMAVSFDFLQLMKNDKINCLKFLNFFDLRVILLVQEVYFIEVNQMVLGLNKLTFFFLNFFNFWELINFFNIK